MATETSTPPVTIRVERAREQLRDYFRRLGATASIDETGAIKVCFEEKDDESVEVYLASWTSVNRIPAAIEPAKRDGLLFADLLATRPRLGEVLVARRLITEEQLDEALRECAQSGDLLGRVLLRRRWLFEDELARALSEQLHVPYVNIRSSGVDRGAARMIPAEIGRRYAAIPIGFVNGKLTVGFADPCDEMACAAVADYCGDYQIAVAELSAIESAWRGLAPPSASYAVRSG